MDVRRAFIAAFGVALTASLAWLLVKLAAAATASLPDLGAVASHARLGRLAVLRSHNYADFESGNIGRIDRVGPASFTLQLRSDNDDALPKYWRQWFYFKLDDLPTNRPTTLTIEGAGQWSYYVPFYSYDNVNWRQFSEADVTQPGKFTLRISHRFERREVWIARYVPYTYSRLQAYLGKIKRHPDVLVTDIGRTPGGRLMPLLTITDGFSRRPKTRVVLHARTHPGEVGSSFLLEGLIDFLLSKEPLARRLRENLIFTILPMLNVDGVVAGNNRVSPEGINLEGKWYTLGANPLALDDERTPPEVRLFHGRLLALLRQGVPVSMALNLHASAGEPEDNVFIFPHFGPERLGYRPGEARLFAKQLDFIGDLCDLQGKDWFNRPPDDGTRAFLDKSVPEAWWWRNFQDQVMAVTIESTYGRAGRSRRWVKPEDMRRLGRALGRAIARYHGLERDRVRVAH